MEGLGTHTWCECLIDFTGNSCETEILHCMPGICMNGGTCQEEAGDTMSCDCAEGYTGERCGEDDRNYIACMPSTCENGGTCNEEFGPATSCSCLDGFTDDTCGTDLPFCTTSTCQNGGTCVEGVGRVTACICADGFTGDSCQTDLPFCTATTCSNGGTCIEGIGEATSCMCVEGFSGESCETDLPFCTPDTCLNGGTCEEGLGPDTTCTCASGFTGQSCEILDACRSNSDCTEEEFCQITCPSDSYASHTTLLSETVRFNGVSFVSVPPSKIPSLTGDISIFIVFRQEPGNQGYLFFYGTSPESRNIGIFLDATDPTDPTSDTTPGIYLYYTSRAGNTVNAIRVPTSMVTDNRTHSLVVTLDTSGSSGNARFFIDGFQVGSTRVLTAPDLTLNVSNSSM